MAAIIRILVTTDFSESGNKAIPEAFNLAAQLGARVFLCTVIERGMHNSGGYIDFSPRPSEEILKKAQVKVKQDLLALVPKSMAKKVSHQAIAVVDDRVEDGILSAIEKNKAQILVIASHGMSGLQALLLGSTTDRLLRSTPIPALLVRSK